MSAPVDLTKLKPGEVVAIGCKVYGRCADCRQIVRIDKPIFGSAHFCVDP